SASKTRVNALLAPLRYALRRVRDSGTLGRVRGHIHRFKRPVSFPRRDFCVRVLHLCFTNPRMRVGGAPRVVRVLRGTPVSRAHNAAGRALREAPCVPYRGTLASRRSTVAVLGSGAALPSPSAPAAIQRRAFAFGSVQRAPRSQVVVPGGRGPEPPGTSGYKPSPRDATPRSAFRFALENAPSMSEAATYLA